MAIDNPEDFEALRRRVDMLSELLEAILGAEVPRAGVETGYYFDKRFSSQGRKSRFPENIRYIIDRYYFRREQVFAEAFGRIGDLRSVQEETSKKLSALEAFTTDQLTEAQHSLSVIESRTRAGAAELHQWLAIQTLGLVQEETRTTRFLPMRAYLSDIPENGLDELTVAINGLIETFGFEVSDEFPEVLGSWFKKWFVRTKDLASKPEVNDRLAKIERAIELKGLGSPQAEIDSKQAGAIAALNTSLANVPSAAIQVGSILYLKLTVDGSPVVQARNLTQKELIILENNQDLLNSPSTIMTILSKMCPKDNLENIDSHLPQKSEIKGLSDIWQRKGEESPQSSSPLLAPITPRLPYAGSPPPKLGDDDTTI